MNKSWKTYKLGDLVTFQRGHDLTKAENIEGKYLIAGSNGIIGYHNSYTTKGPGVTIGRSGNIGNAYYYEEDFWAHNTTLYVKEFKNSDPKFIYYLLRNLNFGGHNSGSAVPSLNRNYIHPIEVLAPETITEQKEIASILSSLDDKIELNLQMNQTLEAMAQALFKEWFVNFNFPGFDGKLENYLPIGWKEEKLSNAVEVKGGTTPSTKESKFWDGEFHWATPKDLSNLQSPVLLTTERKITEAGVKEIGSGILPKGTLLLSSRAPVGYLAVSQIPVSINQGFIAIQGKSVSNLFMFFWLVQNMELVKSKANGSTFQEVSKGSFKEIEIVVPSKNIVDLFDEVISPIFERIVNNEKENQALTQLRDSLLPKLMSGKITVNNN
jgi:type I restriction enzyme S subunit